MSEFVVVPEILVAEIRRLHGVTIPLPATITNAMSVPFRQGRDLAVAALFAGGWTSGGINQWVRCGIGTSDRVRRDPVLMERGRVVAERCHAKYLDSLYDGAHG